MAAARRRVDVHKTLCPTPLPGVARTSAWAAASALLSPCSSVRGWARKVASAEAWAQPRWDRGESMNSESSVKKHSASFTTARTRRNGKDWAVATGLSIRGRSQASGGQGRAYRPETFVEDVVPLRLAVAEEDHLHCLDALLLRVGTRVGCENREEHRAESKQEVWAPHRAGQHVVRVGPGLAELAVAGEEHVEGAWVGGGARVKHARQREDNTGCSGPGREAGRTDAVQQRLAQAAAGSEGVDQRAGCSGRDTHTGGM